MAKKLLLWRRGMDCGDTLFCFGAQVPFPGEIGRGRPARRIGFVHRELGIVTVCNRNLQQPVRL